MRIYYSFEPDMEKHKRVMEISRRWSPPEKGQLTNDKSSTNGNYSVAMLVEALHNKTLMYVTQNSVMQNTFKHLADNTNSIGPYGIEALMILNANDDLNEQELEKLIRLLKLNMNTDDDKEEKEMIPVPSITPEYRRKRFSILNANSTGFIKPENLNESYTPIVDGSFDIINGKNILFVIDFSL